jgi:lipoate-protein ligase B
MSVKKTDNSKQVKPLIEDASPMQEAVVNIDGNKKTTIIDNIVDQFKKKTVPLTGVSIAGLIAFFSTATYLTSQYKDYMHKIEECGKNNDCVAKIESLSKIINDLQQNKEIKIILTKEMIEGLNQKNNVKK